MDIALGSIFTNSAITFSSRYSGQLHSIFIGLAVGHLFCFLDTLTDYNFVCDPRIWRRGVGGACGMGICYLSFRHPECALLFQVSSGMPAAISYC